MGLLKVAKKEKGFLKCGIYGFEGSGKTSLATTFGIGLAKKTGIKSIAMFDTEKGSDFLLPRLDKEGIELHFVKSRAFKDLCEVTKETANGQYACLIIDSISHVWKEIVDAYKAQKNKKFITMKDWGLIKGQWQDFTDLFLNTKLNIVMCGRAGNEFDYERDEDTGKQEFFKSGTKMKVEGEMGYESHLLIETFKQKKSEVTGNIKDLGIIHSCFVWKDKNQDPKTSLTGKEFINPKFENFGSHFAILDAGERDHVGFDATRNSKELFESPDRSFEHQARKREILLEQIKEVFILNDLSGTSQETQKKRAQHLIDVFGTSGSTAIENLPLKTLEDGLTKLQEKFYAKEITTPNFDVQLTAVK